MSRKLNKDIFLGILERKYYKSKSEFSNCYFTNDKGELHKIIISDYTFADELEINGSTWNFTLELNDCVFKANVLFKSVKSAHDLIISNCEFGNNLSFSNCHFDKLVLDKTSIRYILKLVFLELSLFQANIFAFCLRIENGNYGLIILGEEKSEIQSIIIGSYNTIIGALEVHKINKDFVLEGVLMEIFYCSAFIPPNGVFTFKDVLIKGIMLNNFNNEGIVKFNNVTIYKGKGKVTNAKVQDFFKALNISDEGKHKIMNNKNNSLLKINDPLLYLQIPEEFHTYKEEYFDRWINIAYEIKLQNSKEDISNLIFRKSILGDFRATNVLFENFDAVSVRETDLSTLKLTNSKIPIKCFKGDWERLHDNFNQLMIVAKRDNNKREEIEYRKGAHNALLLSYFRGSILKNLSSILSLLVSKLFSNYGTNWIQSVTFSIFVSGIIFALMILCSNYDLDLSSKGMNKFIQISPYYFHFLNPAHNISFIDLKIDDFKYSTNLSFVALDIVGRIVIGIGIYETIIAFRKFSKN